MLVDMSGKQSFFEKYWRAIAWTVCYIFIMWAILRGLFNFNVFSVAHLSRLARVELRGFAGLVFGILILAAVPLYVATTVLTVRNKSVPFHIPLPKCFAPAPEPEPEPAPEPIVTEQEALPELHTGIPAEMRESFMRARKNYGVRQMSVFNRPGGAPVKPNVAAPVVAQQPEFVDDTITKGSSGDISVSGGFMDTGDFPVPTDFDIDVTDTNSDVPVFSDINFDDNEEEANQTADADNSDLQEYLRDTGIETSELGNLIVVNNFAVAVHDDDDFWAPDDVDWFAAGRQKPSPIAELLHAHDENNYVPVFLIERNNIMDFESNVKKWRDDGIIVVMKRAELLDVIKNQTNN